MLNNSEDMVMCNFCGEWFHGPCVGITVNELQSIKQSSVYKCRFCHDNSVNEQVYDEGKCHVI